MASRRRITVDGNEAAASVAYRVSEAIAIYPITPSSTMAELCDEWASRGQAEPLGRRPRGGRDAVGGRRGRRGPRRAAGRCAGDDVHGVAGPAPDDPQHVQDRRRADALHHARGRADARHACAVDLRRPLRRHGLPPDRASRCSARTRCRKRTTWRPSRTPRRLESRIPFLHFFDGFRTSHEVAKIELLDRRRPARA